MSRMNKVAAELKLSQLKEQRKVKELRLLRLEAELLDKPFLISASIQAVHQKKQEHADLTKVVSAIDRQMERVREKLL